MRDYFCTQCGRKMILKTKTSQIEFSPHTGQPIILRFMKCPKAILGIWHDTYRIDKDGYRIKTGL